MFYEGVNLSSHLLHKEVLKFHNHVFSIIPIAGDNNGKNSKTLSSWNVDSENR